MGRPVAPSQWRGWQATDEGNPTAVVSQRLAAGAPVHNRLFPKVRSWFALGAPLELLSPLSVARIVVLVGLVSTILVLLTGQLGRPALGVAVAAVATVAVAASARVRELTPRGCHVVAAGATAGVVTLVGAGQSGLATVVPLMFLVPLAVFVGLFLRLRAVLGYPLVAALGVLLAVTFEHGPVLAVLIAGATFLASTTAALTVMLVAQSARRQSTIDPDTGLPNGYGLAEQLAADTHLGPFVIATVVLGGLGEAREALGYQVGTELIRRAVEDLGQVVPADARIARVDGDELVVAQPINTAGAADGTIDPDAAGAHAAALAGRLVDAIGSGRYLAGGVEVTMRASVGYVVAPFDGDDVTELIRRASLSARKAVGSAVPQLRWDGSDGAMTSADLALLADLRSAAANGELWVAYQPQIDSATGRTVSVEALMRWTSPQHGFVSPGDFIPLAERVGLIDRLTEWVLAEVLDAQLRWVAAGLWLPVSVNFSALSLADPGLSEGVLDALRQRGLPTGLLAVEVTETAAVDVVQAVDRLRPLHDMGVRVSIDDFGTGYTSLSVLPHLPIDELKVDQRFVMASSTSPADVAIVEAVTDLAHRLGLDAVAEGVEDEEIAERMRSIGVDLLQGYHFARPLEEADLIAFVTEEREAAAAAEAQQDAAPADASLLDATTALPPSLARPTR